VSGHTVGQAETGRGSGSTIFPAFASRRCRAQNRHAAAAGELFEREAAHQDLRDSRARLLPTYRHQRHFRLMIVGIDPWRS